MLSRLVHRVRVLSQWCLLSVVRLDHSFRMHRRLPRGKKGGTKSWFYQKWGHDCMIS